MFTGYFDGALLKPDIRGIHVLAEDDEAVTVEAGAAVEWDDLVAWSVERGLWGAENLSLIPGTVGAAPVQNIGAYGAEAKDVITRVHLFDTERREHGVLTAEECRFAYRDSIFKHELRGRAVITSVEFRFGKRPAPDLGYGDLQRETEARGGASLRNIREAVCAIRRGKLLLMPDTRRWRASKAGAAAQSPCWETRRKWRNSSRRRQKSCMWFLKRHLTTINFIRWLKFWKKKVTMLMSRILFAARQRSANGPRGRLQRKLT